jgi:hypothetical protein
VARRDDLRTDQPYAHPRPPIQVPNRDPSLARHDGEHGRARTGGEADHRSVGEDPRIREIHEAIERRRVVTRVRNRRDIGIER